MSFAELVQEARQLPIEEMVELREVLDRELTEAARDEFHAGHLEALQLFKEGKLPTPTSDVDVLIRSLESE
jgi:hypothetical protein